LTVDFASTPSSVCTVSGTTVTLIAAGTCTIKATQPGNAVYKAAPAVSQSFAVHAAVAPSVTLSWTESSGSVSGYNVYRSTLSGTDYTRLNSSIVPSPTYTDGTVSRGKTYYYVVTAVNTSGVESAYSAQVSAAIPAS
jgi:fibronectin type 3 domain-containing protein